MEDIKFTLRRHPIIGGLLLLWLGVTIFAFAANQVISLLQTLGVVAK